MVPVFNDCAAHCSAAGNGTRCLQVVLPVWPTGGGLSCGGGFRIAPVLLLVPGQTHAGKYHSVAAASKYLLLSEVPADEAFHRSDGMGRNGSAGSAGEVADGYSRADRHRADLV
jgi:hypothetical protein